MIRAGRGRHGHGLRSHLVGPGSGAYRRLWPEQMAGQHGSRGAEFGTAAPAALWNPHFLLKTSVRRCGQQRTRHFAATAIAVRRHLHQRSFPLGPFLRLPLRQLDGDAVHPDRPAGETERRERIRHAHARSLAAPSHLLRSPSENHPRRSRFVSGIPPTVRHGGRNRHGPFGLSEPSMARSAASSTPAWTELQTNQPARNSRWVGDCQPQAQKPHRLTRPGHR